MNDDSWLQEIAQVHRDQQAEEQERLDERWDRLSSGELSPEEEEELRALAAASEEAREAYEAFQPLGPEFHARVVRAIWPPRPAPIKDWLAKLLPFRPGPSFAGWSAAASTIAATLVFLLRPAAPFLNYTLMNVVPAFHEMRGEEPAPMKIKTFAPGDRLKVTIRPETAASHIWPWDAGCYLSGGDEPRRLKVVAKTFSSSGVAALDCALSGNSAPGIWTLWAVIGRWGTLPDPSDLRFTSTHGPIRARDWVALGEEIRIQPPEP